MERRSTNACKLQMNPNMTMNTHQWAKTTRQGISDFDQNVPLRPQGGSGGQIRSTGPADILGSCVVKDKNQQKKPLYSKGKGSATGLLAEQSEEGSSPLVFLLDADAALKSEKIIFFFFQV